jgi:ABC-type transporter Mla subunit MlaD
MAARDPTRYHRISGAIVVLIAVVLFGVLFVVGQREGTWEKRAQIYADFKTIAGLRRDSPVHLAGVEIGKVQSIDFVNRRYLCDPQTEDIGRHGDDRTDDCDEFTFCAPTGVCAELENYTAKGLHMPCFTDEDCGEEEVCVTADFRKRAKRQSWSGSDGMCARFSTEHRRVQVTMDIIADRLDIIGGDSKATIASNGVLGDQQVNITPGVRLALGEDHRIQATPSFGDNIEMFRERADGFADKLDSGLGSISSTFTELNDEQTIDNVKKKLDDIALSTEKAHRGEGRIGGLLKDPSYEKDFTGALRKARDTAVVVDDFVARATRTFHKIDTDVEPAVHKMRQSTAKVRVGLQQLDDPTNNSVLAKLLRDKDGRMLSAVEHALSEARSSAHDMVLIASRVDRGEGALGRLVADGKLYNDIDHLIIELQHNWLVTTIIKLGNAQPPEGATKRGRAK